jgi:hypothetical protein
LIWDDLAQTVSVDGKDYQIDNPKTYHIYRTIATAEHRPITRAMIQQQVAGVRGRKAIPQHIEKLPAQLRKTIESNTTGYWLKLPPVRKSKRG